jgi:hypothetical protein
VASGNREMSAFTPSCDHRPGVSTFTRSLVHPFTE